jgi:hypothetical protein
MPSFDPADIDLDRLFAALTSRSARESERQRLRAATLAAAGRAPLTGGWYWVPFPDGDGVAWQVQAFFDCWRSPSAHVCVWQHVRDSLEHHWRLRLPYIECYSLPRGRVSRRADTGIVTIYHGRDAPRGSGGLAAVRRAFKLPRSTPATFDEHEQCIAGQPEVFERALGIKLGIRGTDASSLDWS